MKNHNFNKEIKNINQNIFFLEQIFLFLKIKKYTNFKIKSDFFFKIKYQLAYLKFKKSYLKKNN